MVIYNREGHTATFEGTHNAVKSKVLIVLYDRLHTKHNKLGAGLADLHNLTGCDYDTLKASVAKWVTWKLILRHKGENEQGKPVYTYVIAQRGTHFVEDRIPPDKLAEYVQEIKEYRAKGSYTPIAKVRADNLAKPALIQNLADVLRSRVSK